MKRKQIVNDTIHSYPAVGYVSNNARLMVVDVCCVLLGRLRSSLMNLISSELMYILNCLLPVMGASEVDLESRHYGIGAGHRRNDSPRNRLRIPPRQPVNAVVQEGNSQWGIANMAYICIYNINYN